MLFLRAGERARQERCLSHLGGVMLALGQSLGERQA